MGGKKYCLLAALGVRNAFNSARWENICRALDRLGIPTYLQKMIKSYLENRLLIYEKEEGPKNYQITGGVLQGSVLGPPLWNIIYDDMLKIKLPTAAEIVAFAGLVITGMTLEEIRRIFGECYKAVQWWMGSVGLKLAEHKTDVVLFTSKKQVENITLDVGQYTIASQTCIRYLRVMLDARLSFKPHVEHAAAKAARGAIATARVMPIKECRRKIPAVNRLSALKGASLG